MADRGNVEMAATAALAGIATYDGPSAGVQHAHFSDVQLAPVREGDVTETTPKVTGQLWPRGDQ